MKSLYQLNESTSSINRVDESTSYFVYGISDIRPESNNDKDIKDFALRSIDSFYEKQSSLPKIDGYLYKFEVLGDSKSRNDWRFISVTSINNK